MNRLFLFGTLVDEELRTILVGPNRARSAHLPDRMAEWSICGNHAVCIPNAGTTVEGVLLCEIAGEALSRLDHYEAVFDKARYPVTVRCDGVEVAAEAYLSNGEAASPRRPWDQTKWQQRDAPLARRLAVQIADEFLIATPPKEIAQNLPVLAARAQAEIAARERRGPHRVDAPLASDIEDIATRTVYSRFFRVDERDIQVPAFDGQTPLEMQRVAFLSVDAVIVLPYDPVRDRVLLIEQFRIGPHVRGDADPWLLEAVAGRVDGGESWEETAHREAREEAGLQLKLLEKVAEFYPSPGAVSEFLVAYVGLVDLPDGVEGIHGLESEHEDIRSRVLSFSAFEVLMAGGHFRNAPLLITAQWLVANRDRLRSAANGA